MLDINFLSDQELAALLKEGDGDAFEIIYKKYWDKLLVVAGKRLHDLEEAEEVVQDIFLNLWKRREKFSLNIGFDNYFAVAVKYEIINRLAKRSREYNRNKQFSQGLTEKTEMQDVRFDFELLQRQLESTISHLPPKCQLVFRMSRRKEYTNRVIAQKLNISEKAVEKHITNALKTLRTIFKHYLTIFLFFL